MKNSSSLLFYLVILKKRYTFVNIPYLLTTQFVTKIRYVNLIGVCVLYIYYSLLVEIVYSRNFKGIKTIPVVKLTLSEFLN